MRVTLIAVVLLAGACKEPLAPTRDGGRPVPDCTAEPTAALCDIASQDNVLFSYAKDVCSLLLDCCSQPERTRVAEALLTPQGLALALIKEPSLFVDATACRRAVTLSLFGKYQRRLEALDDGRQHFDIEAARTCLSWLEAGADSCAPGLVLFDDAHQPRSCAHMFVPNVRADEKCFDDSDCADADDGGALLCEGRSALLSDGGVRLAVDGRCRPLPGLGEACGLPTSRCVAGAFCAFDQRCQLKAAPGEPCEATPCNDLGVCDATRSPAVCGLRRSYYGPCATSAECFSGLGCDPGLRVCLPQPDLNPLDVQFDYCLGDQRNGVARELPFVPKDGGLE